jgi:tetratricopeptide (TPR) repeat protein
MRQVLITLTILFGMTLLAEAADNCDAKKKLYENKLDQWKEIETKMKSPEVTKAQYDGYLPQYKALWDEAETLKADYLKCKDESENQHKAAYNDGIRLKKEKNYKEALDKFKEALKIKNDFTDALEQIADVNAEMGNYAEMEKSMEKLTDDEARGKIYYKVGNNLMHTSPDQAIEYYLKMSKFYKPDNAFYLIGGVYVSKKNDPKNAVVYYKKALQIDPKDHKTYNALGGSLVELSNITTVKEEKDKLIEEAVSVLLKGVQLGEKGYRKYYELCVRLAQLYNLQGKAISALEYADKSIKLSKDSKYSLGHLERAVALIKMKKFDDAKKSLAIAQEDFLTKQSVEFWLAEIERSKN